MRFKNSNFHFFTLKKENDFVTKRGLIKHFALFAFVLLFPLFSFAQKTINGLILGEKNTPLPGATVKVKSTTRSTFTDVNGIFTLEIPKGKNVIVVSFLGYDNQEVVITNQEKVTITLKENVQSIGEVVVIGYGEVKKKDATGSISSIKPSDDNLNQAQNLESLIQGRAAGVVINSQGFEPGAASSVQIRGINSLSGNTQPLYVVDGIIINSATEKELDPLTGGNSYLSVQNGLQGLNPRDIESMEILKDASATAIYGSRGSNGVILITTKKGKSGKAKFNYFVNTRVGEIARPISMLNAREYAEYQNKAKVLSNLPEPYTIDDNGNVFDATTGKEYKDNNWQDKIYKTSVSYNHRFSVSGGVENNNYYFAAGHSKADGLVDRSFTKLTDFSANLNNKLTNNLKMSTKIAVTFANNSGSKGTENLGSTGGSITRQILGSAPFLNYSGNYLGEPGADITNVLDGPNAWIQDYDDISNEFRGLGGLTLEYTINNTFKFKSLFGADYRKKNRQIWYGSAIQRGALVNGEAGLSILDRFKYNWDNTLLFNRKFNSKHNINGTIGMIIEDTKTTLSSYQAQDFLIKDLRANGITLGENFQPLEYRKLPESLISYIGRVNYNLYNRYNLTGTFRADGSSKFIKSNRFSYFPSFAFAWQMNKESFLKNFSKLDELKLRLGWGMTGNQAITPFQTLSVYNSAIYSDSSGNGTISLAPGNLQNQNLIWETTNQYNTGIDLGFFDKRITASIDAYYKKTRDLLFQENIPASSGYATVFSNKGSLENRGIEGSLSIDVIRKDNFKWNVFGNISKYRNKIVDLNLSPRQFGSETMSAYLGNIVSGGNTFKVPANIYIEGEQAGLFWGLETNGIINDASELANAPTSVYGVAPRLGDVLIVDQNGDRVINDSDKTVIGNPNPDFTYGFGTNVSYKGWSLNLFFNGVYGNDVANGNLLNTSYARGISDNITPEAYYNAWSPENPNGSYPRINYNQQVDATGFTDRIIEDGSFLRLSNVTLAYSLPIQKNDYISGIDLSIAANNLHVFTKYSGYDPEVNSFSFDPLRKGLDWQSFPNQRSFIFGANISF